MGLFGRRSKRSSQGQDAPEEPSSSVEAESQDLTSEDGGPAGPADSEGRGAPQGYVDLGSLYVPRLPGLQLRGKVGPDKTTLNRILLVLGSSGITVSVAAAPKSAGAWEELSGQISTSISAAGGQVTKSEGPFGQELNARIGVQLPDGTKGLTPLRVIGVEGPRWVLRIDVQGAAAAGNEEEAAACEDLIRSLIVNRGSEPKIRFEILPLTLPKDAAAQDGI